MMICILLALAAWPVRAEGIFRDEPQYRLGHDLRVNLAGEPPSTMKVDDELAREIVAGSMIGMGGLLLAGSVILMPRLIGAGVQEALTGKKSRAERMQGRITAMAFTGALLAGTGVTVLVVTADEEAHSDTAMPGIETAMVQWEVAF